MTSPVSRRDFLRISGLGGTLAALAACSPFDPVEQDFVPTLSKQPAAISLLDHEGLIHHTLRRTTFGPTAAELQSANRLGLESWLEGQLDADDSDSLPVLERLTEFETFEMTPAELVALDENGRVARELVGATIVRHLFSPTQLFEIMVDFWTNHFSIYAFSPPEIFLKGADDRQVVRAHALGKFPDMLRASAHSPAMLIYLDNAQSQRPSPNENYARELLELHTLGVEGGYTYSDIQNVARAFTGWSVGGFRRRADQAGQFVYLQDWHDANPKTVLGSELPGGKGDADRVLEILAEHPSTARFVASKLVRRFVADLPPDSLIDRVAKTYGETGGDIPDMLRTILYSDEFAASAGLKLKRPLDYAMSLLRVTGADGRLDRVLQMFLRVLGQIPFGWPAPDGYPDYATSWTSTNQSLYRWNMALMTASGLLPGVTTEIEAQLEEYSSVSSLVDGLSAALLGEQLPKDARTILVEFGETLEGTALPRGIRPGPLMAGLVLCTPQFQLR